MSERPPFHHVFPVNDLAEARYFYGELLDCPEGLSSDKWVDFDFCGHQIVAHLSDESNTQATNCVDGKNVPLRHFGLVLPMNEWHAIADRLKDAGADFIVEPHVRFTGQAGEQATLFVLDPSGNALEFKAFGDPGRLFEK
jgi:extradiol dioxygenase family protein